MSTKGRVQKLTDTDEGLELLQLLKEITADGRLHDRELLALKAWSNHVRECEVLAIRKLVSAVDHVCADGAVTPDEREFLFKTIESLLPPEDRAIARFRRQQAKKDDKAFEKEVKRLEREEARELAARDKPVERLDMFVAGVRHENREPFVRGNVRAGDSVYLYRDRANQFSRNAVGVVHRSGVLIGYVPEDDAATVAPLLDAAHLHRASVKKLWTSRDGSVVPIIIGEIYRPDAQVPGALAPSSLPKPRPAPSPLPVKGIVIAVLAAIILGSCVVAKALT